MQSTFSTCYENYLYVFNRIGDIMLYFRLAILALILGLGATAYIYYLKYQNVGQQLEQALEINKANTRVMKELREDVAAEKLATAKELAAAQKRATALDKQKEELDNAPDAQKPVGPFFDELGDRLRSLNSGTAN